MADIYEEFEFAVRSYECAPDGKVTVANLCNYLQEAASINAEHLGFNKSNFDAEGLNITWVMTRMRIKCSRRPVWGEKVKILTFPRNARRIIAHRDFLLEGVGAATTEWMMIDMNTRRPVSIPEFVTGNGNDVREPVLGAEPFAKFKWEGGDAGEGLQVAARASDIDLNGHVNNVRYINWLFDAYGSQPADAFDFELVFKNEMRLGETGTACADGDFARIADQENKEFCISHLILPREI